MVAPHVWGYVSENIWKENSAETVSEMKGENKNGIEEGKEDYFLKGFLVGYSKEKDRILRERIKQEEKVRKEYDVKKEEKEWRSEVREMIQKEVTNKLDDMNRRIESLNKDRKRLKLEIEELKMKLEEEREEKRTKELNWKESKQESKIEP